ncbi:MAG: GGDEF domain-containing protein [Paucibacter sp.]|nr:GGDEF domain-containing protein [Roseateles sp.]
MNTSAAPQDDSHAGPAGLAQWLAAQPALAGELGGALLGLIEPMHSYAAIKAVTTGRYVYAASGLAAVFDRGEMQGRSDNDLMRPDEAIGMRRVEQTVMAQRHLIVSEHKLELGGRRREFSVARLPLGPDHVLSVWHERTEERNRESHLQRALTQIEQQQKALEEARRQLQVGTGRDDDSGLYLRPQFDDQLLREIDLSTREHREFALVVIALDPPRPDVQALAADARQRMLEGVGRMLRANTRAMDSACRIGEERFAVLLSGVGLATAHARMEQLRRQCTAQIVVLNGQDLGMSLSMGVSSFPHTASKQEVLVQSSEAAVAEAQRRGGNQVVLASIPFGALHV